MEERFFFYLCSLRFLLFVSFLEHKATKRTKKEDRRVGGSVGELRNPLSATLPPTGSPTFVISQ
jgi:hypothetical protein